VQVCDYTRIAASQLTHTNGRHKLGRILNI